MSVSQLLDEAAPGVRCGFGAIAHVSLPGPGVGEPNPPPPKKKYPPRNFYTLPGLVSVLPKSVPPPSAMCKQTEQIEDPQSEHHCKSHLLEERINSGLLLHIANTGRGMGHSS